MSGTREIESIEHAWVVLSDGVRLSARIWRPVDAHDDPVPAILEYIPYRKRDFTRARDESMHPWFAARGYAAVRVDLRGSGESEGVLRDEYLARELDDAVEVIEWLAAQPWCTGRVGMMGKSWGGFNALQVAARRPPALGAIVTVCSTDDRYAVDVHYSGGCLLNDNLWWGAIMHLFNARPPDPRIVGDAWRQMWHERLDALEFWPETWMRHPHRDAYWKHGSVCESFESIACPVYAIGGWQDGYPRAVLRLLEHLRVPRRGLIGPWSHLYPHEGVPAPAIGFLTEALRWWDRWLKDDESATIMDEPMLRAWMAEPLAPRTHYDERPGRWIGEPAWPPANEPAWILHPGEAGLDEEATPPVARSVRAVHTVGRDAGDASSFAIAGDLPGDQRRDDACSLVFDSAPLHRRREILGTPRVMLELESDRRQALVAVRIGDVAPDGAVHRVSWGLLNLTHRDGHESPAELVPGRRYRVTVELKPTAHAFAAGHRVRLALSPAYWPIAWPSPQPVTLTVHTAQCAVLLPERTIRDESPIELAAPEPVPPARRTTLRRGRIERTVSEDLVTGVSRYRRYADGGVFGDWGRFRVDDIDLVMENELESVHEIHPADPLSARARIVQSYAMEHREWRIRITTEAAMHATADTFEVEARLRASEGDEEVYQRNWRASIPRLGC